MNYKISIIIPVYNVENTIRRCLDSVLAQTYDLLEIIVVDDGSIDKTADILDTYQDKRLKVIHQKNSGQGVARNVGIRYATGDYVGFVDGDDAIDKHMYSRMLRAAYDNEADVVQCNLSNVYSDGICRVQLPEISCVVDRQKEPQYYEKYMSRNIHSFEVCNKIFKRELLLKYGLAFHDTKKVYAEDLLFNLELVMKMKKIVFLEEHYYFYYLNYQSHSKVNNVEKLMKLRNLFALFISEVNDKNVIRQTSIIAVLVLMLEIAYEQIVKAGTNIAVFNYFLVYDDHISEPYLSLPKSSMIDIQKNDSEYLCRLLKEEVYLGACVFNKLFKTSFIRETGILFESRTKIFAEDAFFYYKLLKKIDKICIIDETLYFYYQRATSASNGYKPDLNKKIETFISELDCYYQFHACYPAIHKSLQMLCFEYFIQVLYNERNHGIAYVSFKKIIKSKFFRNQLIGLSFKEISLKRKLFYLLYRCKMYRLIYRVSKNRKGDDGVC